MSGSANYFPKISASLQNLRELTPHFRPNVEAGVILVSNKRRYLILMACVCELAGAQGTRVNLSAQAKSANLSNIGPTEPMQTGSSLPASCSVGQMFFLTTAAPGANIYACTATNIWSVIAGSGGGGGTGGTLTPGTGIVITQSGSNATIAADTAVMATQSSVQAATYSVVTLTSASNSALTGTMNPTLGAYGDKQLIELSWNVACAGGAMTLSIDGLAATNLVHADGASTLSTADCPAGGTNLFSYDGTIGKFKLIGGGAASGGGSGTVTFPNSFWLPGAYGHSGNFSDTVPWTTPNGSGAFPVSGNAVFNGLNFPPTGTSTAYWSTIVPANWTGTLTVQLYSTLNNGSTGAGTYILYVSSACISPGTTNISSPPPFNTESPVSVTLTGSQYQSGNYSAAAVPSTAGCAAGQLMILKVRRAGGTGGDTAPDNAILFGLLAGMPYTL